MIQQSDVLTRRFRDPAVARFRDAAVVLPDVAHARAAVSNNVAGSVRGPVIHHYEVPILACLREHGVDRVAKKRRALYTGITTLTVGILTPYSFSR